MTERYGIIFVCAWNTCRSAMAEYIMRQLLEKHGLDEKFHVDSAGCITSGGETIGKRTGLTLTENNIPFGKHVSKHFTAKHYATFDVIIALDKDILQYMRRKFGGDPDNKIRLLADEAGNLLSIEDPGPTATHAEAFTQIYRGCSALLKELSIQD